MADTTYTGCATGERSSTYVKLIASLLDNSPGVWSKLRGRVYSKGYDEKADITEQWVPLSIKGKSLF